MINESVKLYNQLTGTKAGNTLLDGIYVSNTGNPAGPWNKIADSTKLANSGSALKQSIGGKGYGPGVQAWYNQFLAVDPTERRPRLRGPRGGLRDAERAAHRGRRPARTGTSTSPAGGRTRCTRRTATSAARSRRTPTSTRSRSARSAARRTSTSATTAASTAGPPNGTVNANGNGTDWRVLQRRHDRRAAVLLRRRRQAERRRRGAARPEHAAATRCSSAAACRTTAAR